MSKSLFRRRFVLGFGILFCFASWAYVYYFLQRPPGSGPAGPELEKAAFASQWTQRPVQLLAIGDSITAGLGAKNASHSYVQRLVENPPDEFPAMQGLCLSTLLPNISLENIAVSGSTSLQHEDYILERLTPYDASAFGLVVLTTGGNDIIHNYGRTPPREGAMYGATLSEAEPWIGEFANRLERMLNQIDSLFPGGCEIYLADIYDPTDGVGDAPSVFLPDWEDGLKIHAEYNRVILDTIAARTNVFHVPLHATFLGHGSHCRQFWRSNYDSDDPTYWFYENIEDPNDRGYDAIRRIFLREIVENSSLRPSSN